jgi:hypothetical protein
MRSDQVVDPGDARQQDQAQHHRERHADEARPRLVRDRQLVGQDGNEDQVVDAEDDLEDHHGRQRRPRARIGQEGSDLLHGNAIMGRGFAVFQPSCRLPR